jgi:uncharacterized membrane-anchored protein
MGYLLELGHDIEAIRRLSQISPAPTDEARRQLQQRGVQVLYAQVDKAAEAVTAASNRVAAHLPKSAKEARDGE